MVQNNEILEIVKQFILKELAPDLNPDELDADQPLLESGIIDSFGIMTLLSFIEDKFKLKIQADDLIPENFETLSAIANLITKGL
jgi:acyl carrier protein